MSKPIIYFYLRVSMLFIVHASTLLYGAESSSASPVFFKRSEQTSYVSNTGEMNDIFCVYEAERYDSQKAGFYSLGADLPSILACTSKERTSLAINNNARHLKCDMDCLPFGILDTYVHYFPRVQCADLNQINTISNAFKQQPKTLTLNDPRALPFNATCLYTPVSFDWEENIRPWSNRPVIPRTFDLRGLDVRMLLSHVQTQGLGQGVVCIVDHDEGQTYDLPSQCSPLRSFVDGCYTHRYKIAGIVALGLAIKNIKSWYPHIIEARYQSLFAWRDAVVQQERDITQLQSIIDYARGAAEGNFTKEQIYHACTSIIAAEDELFYLQLELLTRPFGRSGIFTIFMMFLYNFCKPIGVALDFGYSTCASLAKTCAAAWYVQLCCNYAGYRPYVPSVIIPVNKEDPHYGYNYGAILDRHYGECPLEQPIQYGRFHDRHMVLHPDDAAPMIAHNRKIAALLVGVPALGLAGYYAYQKLLATKV